MSEQKGKSNTILIKQNNTLDLDMASDTKSFQNKVRRFSPRTSKTRSVIGKLRIRVFPN